MADTLEGIVLWAVTIAMLIYAIVGTLAAWADRPSIGRHANGSPRPVRQVHR